MHCVPSRLTNRVDKAPRLLLFRVDRGEDGGQASAPPRWSGPAAGAWVSRSDVPVDMVCRPNSTGRFAGGSGAFLTRASACVRPPTPLPGAGSRRRPCLGARRHLPVRQLFVGRPMRATPLEHPAPSPPAPRSHPLLARPPSTRHPVLTLSACTRSRTAPGRDVCWGVSGVPHVPRR